MPKTIVVPESITRRQYRDLMAAVGFVPENLASLRFATDGIYASVIERDENGAARYDWTEPGDQPRQVQHEVYVPVVDEESAR